MKRKSYTYRTGLYKLFIVAVAILSLNSCNNEDDVIDIFTGKTWKLTYISEDGKHIMWDFWGDNDTAYQSSMTALQNTSNFILVFNGADLNGVTGGSFSGKASSATISGQWNADGSSNELTISNVSAGTDADGYIGKAFLNGVTNAKRYDGDNSHLYIYYEEGQRTFVLNFTPLTK